MTHDEALAAICDQIGFRSVSGCHAEELLVSDCGLSVYLLDSTDEVHYALGWARLGANDYRYLRVAP